MGDMCQPLSPKTIPYDMQKMWDRNQNIPPAIDQCIHDLFVEQALARPDAPALCAWDGEMTYRELDEQSTRLAGYLKSLGVTVEDMVPVCFEKSMWTVVAMLAILKAGGAFVPLHPDHPTTRHEEIFRQTGAKVVLASVQYETLWPHSSLNVVAVGEAFMSQLWSEKAMICSEAKPNNAVYVMFTSGSTGVPKGVVLEHRAVITSCLGHGNAIGIGRNTRALQFAAYTFDACIVEIITTLMHGGCVCIPSEHDRRNALSEAINTMKINWAQLTPTVARLLEPKRIPSLEVLVLGGERVDSVDWERWGDCVKQINAYGPTECSVWCTSHCNDGQGFQSGLIGKPMASVSWVVDPEDHNKLASPGAIGELLVEGPILARGYLNDPSKTEAAFINSPPWLERQSRLYKTGDLVYYNSADDNLICVGRKDGQVKVRGQRIELGEIEHHLYQYMPDVKQMAVEVIVPAGENNKAMVAAFLELDKEAHGALLVNNQSDLGAQVVFPAEVDEELSQRLPSHMVPEVYFAVDQMPMTTSIKIDRQRLRALGASFSVQQLAEMRTQSQCKRQPETEKEKTMQQLWARVIGIKPESIGLDDSFFRLGGDSIAAMKLVGEARHIGLEMAVQDVFHAPRLSQLARQIVHAHSPGPSATARANHSGPVAQSFAQGRLWFLEELHPGLDWYLVPVAVHIKGSLQLDALKAALRAVECRHETLRTTFSTIEGTGMQEVHSFHHGKELDVLDIREHELLNALQRDQTTPFNLRSEPGWRISIYRLNEQHHVLSIVMHHIVSDGWSIDVLKRELTVLYAAAVRGQDPFNHLPPLSVQYRDFSIWQRLPEQVKNHQQQLDYWVVELDASRPAEFLCDKPRPATLSGKASTQKLKIEGHQYENLQRFCRARGVTLFVVLLAAFRAVHYRLTGQDDATIGAPNANRDHWELREMIGFFVNMQCLRIKVDGDETFEELVQQVYKTVVASLANQDVPFESIVSTLLQTDRDLARNPLAQVVFAVHSQKDMRKFAFEGLETEVIDGSATSRFDLEFHFYQEEHGLQGYIYFSEDLYTAESISSLSSAFMSFLDSILHKPGTKIAVAPLMTDEAYLHFDHMDETAYDRNSSIIDVFRQQAAAHPSKIAVKDALSELTYAQLDMQSDRLAQSLAARSLAPETAVGVLSHRCCQAIIAFLGILKAGLAYLPLDARAPETRMKSILSTRGPTLVLLGPDIQRPAIKLENVEFRRIADMLNEQANSKLAFHELDTNLRPRATSLAYIMFTSGSTGQPKGVMVEHRGIVRMAKHDRISHFPSTEAMAHMANLAFDGSTWEIYTCLLNGGTLVCLNADTVSDQDALFRAFEQYNVQVAFLTPALLNYLLTESPQTVGKLNTLLVAGDRADPKDLVAAKSLVKTVANAYGPTENSVMSTLYILTDEEKCVNGVPIGQAISNSGAYVVDAEQHLVPPGVIGELLVTGDGIARGYTDSKRDIDRFITFTIGDTTMRAYRTGDYVRQRPLDGQLEFFGRIDGQVKIRGHRVELGEIENALRSHHSVRDAVVVSVQGDDNGKRLFGYVTLKQDSRATDYQNEATNLQHVNSWEDRFDSETYTPIHDIQLQTIGRDFLGWTSMYDGSEIDKTEMNEWLDDTIRSIHTTVHGQPGNVLEIGSGTGMILFNLGDGLQSYVGLDPSRKAVKFIMETAKSIPSLANKVQMYKATAADIGQVERPLKANLVILNSVVQYFPSQEYLFNVVQDLLQIKSVNTLFFGDIRSYALHREFLATRALRMCGEKATKDEIRRMMEDMSQVERELLVDPGFFTSLPNRLPNLIEHVEIQPKKMKATNELSCYRYTAVIYVKSQNSQLPRVPDGEWTDFEKEKLDRGSLLQRLKNDWSASTMAISNIPHSKTIFNRCLLASLDNEKASLVSQKTWISSIRHRAEQTPCLSATDLVELAEEAGCQVEVNWGRQYSQHGGLDAIFYRQQPQSTDRETRVRFRFPTDHSNRPQHTLSSKPLRRHFIKDVEKQLEESLRLQLPTYMVPQSVHVLENIPINENGKVDRKELVQRTKIQVYTKQGSLTRAMNGVERKMQQLWARVLGTKPESIHLDDSFFRLGGDSIAAMKLVSTAREEGMELTVANIFQYPKLTDLAAFSNERVPNLSDDIAPFSLLDPIVDTDQVCEEAMANPSVNTEQLCKEVAASCNVDASLIEDIYPCSPLQEGLMSLASKRAGDYIMQSVLALRADIDEHVFRAAWQTVVRSNAALRTRIVHHNTLGLLQVVLAEDIEWVEAEALEEHLERDKLISMGLGDRLIRYTLIKPRWFVWTIHHALYDGWTVPRILYEVNEVYNGAILQKRPGFNAFIRYIRQQDRKAATAYWQTTLANCQAASFPPLPSTVTQPVADTTVKHQCLLAKHTTDTTTSTLIRAAWAIVTSCYTGLDDVVFGTTVNGRNANVPNIDAIMGPTIATVPVRVRIQRDQIVSSLLQQLHRQATEMMMYEQTGLQVIARMGPDMRHACNFQTLLLVQPEGNVLESNNKLGEWRSHSDLQDFTTYALMVQCTLAPDGLPLVPEGAPITAPEEVHITASFDARVIEPWIVEKMLSQFSFVMQQLAQADLGTKVRDIDTLTLEDEKELWERNQNLPPAVDRCVHDLFTEQALAQPDAPAICAWDGEMTYRELDEQSTRLAGYLVHHLGIKCEDMVPLCFEKSMWTVVAMLAVLKAGGAFVPLDPDHPRTRHGEIVRQTSAKVVLASAQQSARWAEVVLASVQNDQTLLALSSCHVVSVSALSVSQLPEVTDIANATANNAAKPDNAAYVMFTSGSTGVPKGVILEHAATSTSCLGHGQVFKITNQSRVLQFASYIFVDSIAEIVTTLLHGGCICVPSDSDRRNNLTKAINAMNVNWTITTPSVARLLSPDSVPSLKRLVIGGEQVSARDWDRWTSRGVQIINGYGQTECSIICTAYSTSQEFKTGTIGKSVASVSWVVDPENHDRLVPPGSIGELLVEGPILARGYLHDTEKTTAAFIEDPVWLLEGCIGHAGRRGHAGRQGRLYKTGDLVRYDCDGNLVCLGRKDGQVKIRGQRIELGEVEYHVRECLPEVKQLAVEVISPAGPPGQEKAIVAAFLELDKEARSALLVSETPNTDLAAQVVFFAKGDEELAQRLPSYMVPEVYFAVEKLPTTPSLKTDRRRLREIGASFTTQQLAEMRTTIQGPKRHPETEKEKVLQQLWALVLGINRESIGLDDSFFRLGGDSIAAMKLVAAAREKGLGLTVANIFQHPRLASLATLLLLNEQVSTLSDDVTPFSLLDPSVDTEHVREEVAASCNIDASLIEDIYPCSPLQEGLMSLTSKRSGDYIMQCVLELQHNVDEVAFRAAWDQVFQSLQILRTRIVHHSALGLLQAVVADKARWIETDNLATYLKQDKLSSMDLGEPLTRYALVENPQQEKRWLVWTVHHTLYDGWSLPRILKAVRTVYTGAKLEKQPSFATFARYLRHLDHAAAERYWETTLRDCEATIFPSLPSEVQQPVADSTIEYQCPPLPKASADRTTSAHKASANVTISTLIRAAWAILASRYTSTDDVVFGATVTGRNAPVAGIEAMVGPTIATVPLRVHIQKHWTVLEFLETVQQQAAEMIPFEQTGLHRIANLGLGAQHACSFQTLLIVQPTGEELEVDDTFGIWKSGSDLQDFTTYALMVQCTLAKEGVRVVASFDGRVIDEWQVRKMLGQFSSVMQQLAQADLSVKVRDIDTLTLEDKKELWDRNQSQNLPPAVERCIHDLFVERTLARPDAPALCAWDGEKTYREMTYQELDEKSTRLASYLTHLGVKCEDMVPLCFEKSMWTVVAMLAVLKAGGAFVPLDPDHPAARHEEIFRQTGAKIVLASAQYSARWASHHVVTVSAASLEQLSTPVNTTFPAKPTNAAYVLFTSGSTGIPKGVILEHRAVSTSCLGHGSVFGFSENTRALQFSAYTFDNSITEMITTLLHGACICVPSESDRRNDLANTITALKVNWAILTSSVARLLDPSNVPTIKTVVIGAEQVTIADWNRWTGIQTINGYGPTECAVICAAYTDNATKASTQEYKSGTIGTPVASVGWIVDPENHDRLAPLGSIGELLVEGPILARGYLNDTKKTMAAFIEDPAWLLEGCPGHGHAGRRGRLYKTGDLVRYDSNGNLVCLGRKDGQVKLRGQRIELGEVEHHVRECLPEVEQLAVEVVLPSGEKDHAILAAFVRLDTNKPIRPADEAIRGDASRDEAFIHEAFRNESTAYVIFPAGVEEALASRLAEHMVPTVFFALPSFPMTKSGKTDRRRLQNIGSSFTTQQLAEMRTLIQGPKRHPKIEKEKLLQQLWARVLRIKPESVGLDDSFFRLGGDSIAAMKLIGEARRERLQLSVADVFHSPKLIDLAVAAISSDEGSSIPHIVHAETVEQSFAQGRLWFLEELYPGLNWYLMPLAIRIRGPVQLAALNAALLAIENRHETLRTTFATENGVSLQTVHPFLPKELNVVNLPPGDESSRLDVVKREQLIPFDLRREPGWRATVYRLDQNDHVLSIVMHHIVSDGWSADILTRELSTFYAASIHGQGQDPLSQVQPLSIQYRDFSVWQRQRIQTEEYQRQLDYWLTQLQTSRPAELLCDKPRPATLSGKADVQTLEISGPLYAKLQQFCKTHGVTLFVALLAIFRATHFRLTGQDDATIGTVNANRDRWELKDLIGFFGNMQCLRTTIADESFEELVRQVHAVTIASLANQDVPFETIVSKLKNDRDLSRHPLAQLVFVVHSQQNLGQLTLEGVETESLDGPATSRFDLEFHFFQQPDSLSADVIFSTDLYAPETINNMVLVFKNLLEECLKEPTAAVASLPLLTDADYAKLDGMGLIQIKKTAYPRESSIVDVFRQQASAYPSRIAVKDPSEEMTYAQLDEASDVVAQWLWKQCLAPETLVGVFANRRCQTIVAFLGIMKAGLAYLPFDVKIPSKRMEDILSSLPGRKIVLVGADIQPPNISQSDIAFVHIAEALDWKMDGDPCAQESATTLVRPSATSLAYVMYTSGSTGKAKGVMIEHRGVVRLVRDNNIVQHLPVHRVMAHITNLAFDVSTWEIYVALLNGGTLVCIDTETALDPVAMHQTVDNHDISTAVLTPALFRHYISESPAVIAALGMLCVGGEALHPRDFFAAEKIMTGKLINCYGPTENTGISTSFVLTKDEKYTNGVPIGRALSNSGAYVMDEHQRLVPLGVIGELVVTGDGVARGYTDPQRNIGRFVSIQITGAGEKTKAYRTGDYVRYRPTDGQIEFFGRMDGQVKLRGQRIELGEIEHVLRSHKSVTDAVAVLQHHNGNKTQLAGFVTIHEDAIICEQPGDDGGDEAQHVDTWEKQFDAEIYSPIGSVAPEKIGRDFVGWTSMYDGSEIDKTEMNEWLDETIVTMLNGRRPGHVLEIGSGTGMILFNLGNGLESYLGLDPSRNAVDYVEKMAMSIPALAGKVRMHKATAADVGQLERPIANLVVMNSVIQYFPSQEYLFKVVQELVRLDGVQTLFFGDIRSYALYREFLATRALHIAGDRDMATKADLRRMMTDMERVERELLVDPAFFTALPERLPGLVEHVEILPKMMKATNELSCYRYAAVVHIKAKGQQEQGREIRQVQCEEWIDFTKRGMDRQSLQQQLKALSSSPTIAISKIPYSKTIVSRCLVESLDDVATETDTLGHQNWLSSVYQKAQRSSSLSATDLVELAQEAGCRVEISWNRQHSQYGGLDAIFHRYQPNKGENRVMFRFPTDHAERPLHSLSNKPLQQQLLQKTQQQLREMLQDQLPAYMVPQTITVLDTMPINQNGKVDRKMLEQRQEQTNRQGPVQQPTTESERTMQQLWAQILDIEPDQISLSSSFFRLGGDSIAAMKLVSKARKTGVQLSVADIFRHPKLMDLASLDNSQCSSTAAEMPAFGLLGEDVDVAQVRGEMADLCGVDASLVEDVYPCSPLQEGLMSLTAKRAGDYVMQSVLALGVDINEDAFRAAWQHVVRSTAALRTRIVHSKLGLLQVVVKEDIKWVEAEHLEEYLQQDKSTLIGLGDQLSRYAFVKETSQGQSGEKRWFAWTIHHALYDGWSLPRILHAVEQAYNGTQSLERPPSFNAFIHYLGQQDQEAAQSYWQTTLANCEAPPFPLLPSTVTQPVADTIVTHQCPSISIGASDTTTSTLIRAAWAIVASRYTSSEDVVFGATVTGRNAPVAGIDAMIGLTIATVPVRVCVQSDLTVSTFLKALQQQATDMIAHEQTGLQRIAKMGTGPRHACGFQTLLVVQPVSDNLISDMLGEWRTSSELQDFTTYALMMQCNLAPDGVHITASFDARVVERWVVEKMLSQFSFVMQQLADLGTKEKVLADIDATTPEDRQQLWMWNQDVPPAVDRCIHELFAEQVKAQPDAPALYAWDGEMTYSELDTLSSKLAGHFIQLGLKREDAVPLCFEKSMWTVVAMMAVLKAGGAFVPLDPDHPARHEEILRQTGAKIVLTSAQHSARWTNSSYHVVTVSEALTSQLTVATDMADNLVEPDNAAYIIFTSGSTGIPKGVVLQHRALSTSCLGHGQAFGITNHARVLQFTAYTFDVCLAEIFTTLLYGGCICIPSESDRRNDLAKAIKVMQVNCAYLTSSVARLLDPHTTSLEKLILGGEQVNSADWNRWPSSVHVINGYGPTECCVFCTGYTSIPSTQGFQSGIIGRSFASVSWIVDSENRLAPLGSIGELLVEGPILARGYLHDAEKTTAAFIEDPAWLLEGCVGHAGRRGRLYKTGDLVRYDCDGNLICLGRKDGQVKVHGQRIELGDIEYHVLECLPEANQVAVEMCKPSGEGDHTMLAAFIRLESDTGNQQLDGKAARNDSMPQVVFLPGLERELAKRLPKHMVPRAFFTLLQYPMTISGKTDRKRLREMGASFTAHQLLGARMTNQGPKQQPSTKSERTMQQLWAQVLNIEKDDIGLEDSFFELGGDSITAMKLADEARKIGLEISVANLLHNSTLSSSALHARPAQQATKETPNTVCLVSTAEKDLLLSKILATNVDVHSNNVSEILPATHMQDRFISGGIKFPSAAFNYLFMDLGQDVDYDRLKLSCGALLQRFPILRTKFVYLEGKLWQIVLRDPDLSFSRVELGMSLEEGSNAVCTQDSKSSSPLELATSFTLVKSALMEHRLILRLSHAQYDGFCLPLILETLFSIYNERTPTPSYCFSNYLAYIQDRQSLSEMHWRKLLQGSKMTNVTSMLRPNVQGDTTPSKIKKESVINMPRLPKDIRIASIISCAWATVLSHVTGAEDVVYGYLVAGRNSNLPGITQIVGPCVNVVPVRARVHGGTTPIQLINSIQEQHISLGESDSMGFDDMVKTCTDWPATTTFDSVLQHQNIAEDPEFDFAGTATKLGWFENPGPVSDVLSVVSYPQKDKLKIVITGHTHIITAKNADMVLQMLCDEIQLLSVALEMPLTDAE